MKHLILFILLVLTTSACSQSTVKIEKISSSSGNESFISKNYKSKELFFKGKDLISEVNYAYNGWQIYDSLIYIKKGNKICTKMFSPQYSGNSKLKGYILTNVECDEKQIIISNKYLEGINDEYLLTVFYLKDLELLLESSPINDNEDIFYFRNGIKPSLFSEYGIPYDENLYSFSFNINDFLIEDDCFLFEYYEVKRKYKYDKRRLEYVFITVTNKKKSKTINYTEHYKTDSL